MLPLYFGVMHALVHIMAIPFHLAFSLALDGVLDFMTDKGRKYFKKAIERLLDEPFDFMPEDRHLLTNLLTECADKMG